MRAPASGIGAILSAVGASACCLAPAVLPVLGVGTVTTLTALAWVVPYRPWFFGATLVTLAFAARRLTVCRGRMTRGARAALLTPAAAAVALLAYTLINAGWPRIW